MTGQPAGRTEFPRSELQPGIAGKFSAQPAGWTGDRETSRPLSARGALALATEQPKIPGGTLRTIRTDVGPVAPEIDWNYAVIERLDAETLKTILLPFDLGRLVLQHDTSQDLALQAGDIVSIFSQADIRVPIAQQTKFVRLDGEFVHAGVYTVDAGETLRDW